MYFRPIYDKDILDLYGQNHLNFKIQFKTRQYKLIVSLPAIDCLFVSLLRFNLVCNLTYSDVTNTLNKNNLS